MDIFSKSLRLYRKKKGMSQGALAERLGVKANTISNYESGVSSPDLSTFVKIVKILDASPSRMLGLGYEEPELTKVPLVTEAQSKYLESCKECELRERLITQQEKTISALESRIHDLERFNNNHK